jgi:hypothetical protein
MATDSSRQLPSQRRRGRSFVANRTSIETDMKARQSSKIRALGEALTSAGFRTLDQQAKALGLSRSTTWTILKGNHKNSGLSVTIINRILQSPQLPPVVLTKILEYIAEKSAGFYGHGKPQSRRFAARLSPERTGRASSGKREPKDQEPRQF